MYKILIDNPFDSLARPHPSVTFNPEAERKELEKLESVYKQFYATYQKLRVKLSRAEDEMKELKAEFKTVDKKEEEEVVVQAD
jgi:predicted RNase H-like nuclease (RuvC/YqgF family)